VETFERTIYNAEHEQFRAAFRQWLDKEIVPNHEKWEADQIVPRDIWLQAGSLGFLGYHVPEQYGGGGVDDYKFGAIMQEEVSETGVIGSANGMTLHNDIVLPYYLGLATDDQKQRWLPKMVRGELNWCSCHHRTKYRKRRGKRAHFCSTAWRCMDCERFEDIHYERNQ